MRQTRAATSRDCLAKDPFRGSLPVHRGGGRANGKSSQEGTPDVEIARHSSEPARTKQLCGAERSNCSQPKSMRGKRFASCAAQAGPLAAAEKPSTLLRNRLLVEDAGFDRLRRQVRVAPEGAALHEAHALVQAHGRGLVAAGLEPQQRQAGLAGFLFELAQ